MKGCVLGLLDHMSKKIRLSVRADTLETRAKTMDREGKTVVQFIAERETFHLLFIWPVIITFIKWRILAYWNFE